MILTDLTTAQAKLLAKALFPHVNYLLRLKTRMERLDFHQDDKLYAQVVEEYTQTNRLLNMVRYLSCKSGAGYPERE